MSSIASFCVAIATAGIVYLLPGLLLLRHARMSIGERLALAVAGSLACAAAVLVPIGVLVGLGRIQLLVGAAGMIALGVRFPIPSDAIETVPVPSKTLLAPAAFFVVAALQALRPALFTVFDSQAFWAPLGDSIARTGNLGPAWVPTLLQGFPPGVSLIAGVSSVPVGHLNEPLSMLIHPVFGALAVLMTVLIAGRFDLAGARSLALAALVATPLLGRSLVFHDDFIVGFLVAATLYVCLGARRWPAWALAGGIAGAAVSVKLLGVVAVAALLVGLWSQRARISGWVAAGAGVLVGLPWYVANFARFGDPVYPFNSSGGRAFRALLEDQSAYLNGREPDRIEFVGLVAIVVVGVGVVSGLIALRRVNRRLAIGLGALLGSVFVVWNGLHYGTRQLIAVYPVAASVAGYGIARLAHLIPVRAPGRRPPMLLVTIVIWSVVLGVTAWNLADDVPTRPSAWSQTGLYSLVLGWRGSARSESAISWAIDPPTKSQIFGEMNEFWSRLRTEDPKGLVLSFDSRAWYIPQRVLSAGEDVVAVRAYLAGGAKAQHDALYAAGVRFVLTRRSIDAEHPILYRMGPWRTLPHRPDLYRLMIKNRFGRLYRVLSASASSRRPTPRAGGNVGRTPQSRSRPPARRTPGTTDPAGP